MDYKKSVDQIEVFTEYFYVVLYISLATCLGAPLPYSFVRYFIFGLGEKSFFLAWPSWLVFKIP